MNLVDFINRKEKPLEKALLELSGNVSTCNHDCDSFRMRAVRLESGSSIRLRNFFTYEEFKHEWPRDLGWAVSVEKQWLFRPRPLTVLCSVFLSDGTKVEVARQTLNDSSPRWWPLRFDWPLYLKESPTTDLLIEVVSPNGEKTSGAAILGIMELVNLRKPLFEYTRGSGVEIGPGISPQVLPSKDVDVKYLERSAIEDWERLYNSSGKYSISEAQRKLFPLYIVGDAQTLDIIQAESLNFIFSSHVFEHMTNPLGTLEIWRHKLRDNGHVVGVVPDAYNCFDLLQPLSKEEQWLEEWAEGAWEYQNRHYQKWCQFTQPWACPDQLRKTGFAIHVHYYSPRSFGRLLELAVQHLGYRNFHIRSTRNHKDFGFVLQK